MSRLDDSTKQALRLAATGALLHNLGKINAKFLDKQINSAPNNYLFQHILGLIAPHVDKLPANWRVNYDTYKLEASSVLNARTVAALARTLTLPVPLNDRTDYMIGDLIEYLGVKEEWYENKTGKYGIEHIFPGGSRLTHLMNRAHRGASGGEKENIATAQQPNAADLYLSTPFGYETAAPNIHNINNLLQQIETAIQKHLTSPKDPLPLADVIADLRQLLNQALADTRRPLNDVTIGDIGHTSMAFLLTQAAEWILTNRTIDHAKLAGTEADNTLLWRLLSLQTNSLRYLEEAASLADLRVRQQELQNAFQKVSQKLAETLLAVEIYADEQRRLFVFPNVEQTHPAYQAVIQEITDDLNISGLRLTIALSPKPVTSHPKDKGEVEVYVGDEVLKQLQTTPPYTFAPETIATFWQEHTGDKQTQICTACNSRPQGYGAEQINNYTHNAGYYRKKAEQRNICCVCMDRRAGVAQKWAESELNTTVWLDEVSDSNGRLALIVGQWNLESFIPCHFYPHADNSQSKTMWLHTVKFLDSPAPQHAFAIRGQKYTWQAGQSVLSGEQELVPLKQTRLTINAPSQMSITVQDVAVVEKQLSLKIGENLTDTFAVGCKVKCWGQDFQVTDAHSLETINDAGRQQILNAVLWDASHPFIVQKAAKVNVLEITSPGIGARNESFARLRRIWETTQTFWQTVLEKLNQGSKPIIKPMSYRLQIKGELRSDNEEDKKPGRYHTYDLKLTKSIKLSVVWDPQRNCFITCDNLEYLAKPELLGQPVLDLLPKGREIIVEEPAGYGGKNKVWGKITIEQAEPMAESGFIPTIPILSEPRTFMVLVPADKALGVIDAIKNKYEREMGKVRNRLPLHLGVVYFQRRTPLRAALNAGQRMLKFEGKSVKDELWIVEAVDRNPQLPNGLADGTQQFNLTIAITIKNRNGRSLTWYVPALMGDGQTKDNWYPYVFIQGDVSNRQRVFKGIRPKSDNTTEECWLVHAAELSKGDHIYFTPATFDFQWMDSAGARFEIAYDNHGRRRNHPTRPYLLDELETLKQTWELISGPGGLTSSQIYALRDLVEARRESWQPTATAADWQRACQPPVYDQDGAVSQKAGMFWQFCHNAVVNANWKKKPTREERKQLTDRVVSGLLNDVIHLYMGIMKEKPYQEEDENE